ncbi:AAA family ATPase [Thermococcus sp.]|uniref:AAA family ATPase n=2 Tax=Thermococcus sp. TaxID=35749 RepID=UPI0026171864|nr:AAA family ATPase [Thermococcus sp.]
MKLKKLVVKNFKSLKDCEIELDKFNVLIGPNASGKTNLVEVFKLLRKIYVERDENPFLEWWGYNNVVWAGKEELPITIGMLFDVEGYDVYFETTFTGTGGSFRILKETLEVVGYIKITKSGDIVQVEYSENWSESIFKELSKLESLIRLKPTEDLSQTSKKLLSRIRYVLKEKKFEFNFSPNRTLLDLWKFLTEAPLLIIIESESSVTTVKFTSFHKIYYLGLGQRNNPLPIIFPDTKDYQLEGRRLSSLILQFFRRNSSLRQVYMAHLRVPPYPRKETTLKEDASNLVPLLYNIWLREGRLPDEIAKPLSMAFPNMRVFFQLTEDGRVMMKVFENDLELAPPCISDGFYKVLALLTAVYLKPPLLIIDEIENSLHPETLELIIDTLRESESQVIITTHSPVVVDIVEPSNLVLVDKEEGETVFKRIRNPEKIKKFLNEKGITLSEGWLYGSLFENDEQ